MVCIKQLRKNISWYLKFCMPQSEPNFPYNVSG